jgi:hypothetical protein
VNSSVLAVIAEAICLGIFALKNKLTVLGMDLDPNQMFPAMLLGILIGIAGIKDMDDLRELLGLKRRDTSGTGAKAGEGNADRPRQTPAAPGVTP